MSALRPTVGPMCAVLALGTLLAPLHARAQCPVNPLALPAPTLWPNTFPTKVHQTDHVSSCWMRPPRLDDYDNTFAMGASVGNDDNDPISPSAVDLFCPLGTESTFPTAAWESVAIFGADESANEAVSAMVCSLAPDSLTTHCSPMHFSSCDTGSQQFATAFDDGAFVINIQALNPPAAADWFGFALIELPDTGPDNLLRITSLTAFCPAGGCGPDVTLPAFP